jgi:hypothetical protein
MKLRLLVVAALLLTGLREVAVAADRPEHLSKNAQKVIALLKSADMADQEMVEFISYVDRNVDDGKFIIAREQQLGGTFSLNYDFDTDIGIKKFELKYTADDIPFEAKATVKELRVSYKFKF